MMKYSRFMLSMVSILFVMLAGYVKADTTYVSGIIDTNTVWIPAGSPYIVTGHVLVDNGVTLDIEPGVEVRIDSSKYIMIKGTLNAIGTETDSIIITRNETARWSKLWFKPASAGSLKYCRIEYAENSAIYNEATDTLYIGRNTISNNSSANRGGGIHNYGSATITDNTISNNSAYRGGGVCNYFFGSATITDNTISNNSADYGGGIHNYGSATITDNTISNNSADYGGGIYNNYGSATIRYNTITDATASAIYIHSGSASLDSNNLYATGYAVYNNSEDDIDARYNYWGTVSSDTIEMKIWDFYDDFEKGKVFYEPYLTSPVEGIEEASNSQLSTLNSRLLRVYPNPFTTVVSVKCLVVSEKQKISLQIYDLSGRLVKSFPLITNPYSLTPDLKPGIYFLKANGYKPVKVIKLRWNK